MKQMTVNAKMTFKPLSCRDVVLLLINAGFLILEDTVRLLEVNNFKVAVSEVSAFGFNYPVEEHSFAWRDVSHLCDVVELVCWSKAGWFW